MTHPLTEYRKQENLSQSELAERLGERRSNVNRWESGERNIGRNKLAGISEKTGIPAEKLRPDLAELFGGAQ